MSPGQSVSIVIVNFNTRELLRDCLLSLRVTAPNSEIVVVDNASADGSQEMVRTEFAGTKTKLIENGENLGFSAANNAGIRQAQGRLILLLNSDTIVKPGAVAAMTEFLDAHPDVGGVTCRLLNTDGSIQACVSGRPGPTMLFFRLFGLSRLVRGDRARRALARWFPFLVGSTVRGYLDPYTAKLPIEVENISGACLMLRREAIEQVGLLDENFFMYFEDMDYCLRLRSAGWKLYYVPSGTIVHLVGQSSGGRMRDYSLHSYRSLFYFYRKHYPLRTRFAIRLVVLAGSLFRWCCNLVQAPFVQSLVCRKNREDLAQVMRICFQNSQP